MTDSRYQRLQTADEEIVIDDLENSDIEARKTQTNKAFTPSSNIEVPRAGGRHQDSHSSEPTTLPSVPFRESHPADEPDVLRNDTSRYGTADIPAPSTSQERRSHDDSGSGLQKRALDELVEPPHPRWNMFHFQPLFLVSFSVLLISMIIALEVLYQISQHNQGLTKAPESMHYAWTYGPTFGEFAPKELHPCGCMLLINLYSTHNDRDGLEPAGAMC